MIASFMCRSVSSRLSRNGLIRTARNGALCSPLPGNRISFSEQRSRVRRSEISKARLRWDFSDSEELNAIIGLRVARRGTGDQQGDGTSDLMLREPGPGKVAPIPRILEQLDRLHTAAKNQFLTHGRVTAERDNPLRRMQAGDHAGGRAGSRRDERHR